ncbi:MAG: hypothetical protein HXS44_00610 [Theionarchaea archaeon]|nr:hypothetical protein [Theionarchaea archaeon]
MPYKDILSIVKYKREDVIAKKIRKFRELDILKGPYYDINLGAVGENQMYDIYTDVTLSSEDRDLVFQIFKEILGARWIFPIQQEDRFLARFSCNHYSIIGKLFGLLKKKKLIAYKMAASRNRWIKMNPDFFGDPVPSSQTLFDPCTLPDISYPSIKPGIKWNSADITFMQYLQVETDSKSRIRDIEYKKYGHFWRYSQIQSSLRKIESSGIIQSKDYNISPYPRNKCCTFILVLNALQKKPLLTVLHNFGRGCRIYKTYTMAGNTGFLFCWASTEIVPEIIEIFDNIDSITAERIYYLRTHSGKYLHGSSFEASLFNTENQRWEFPYRRVKKEIENLIAENR